MIRISSSPAVAVPSSPLKLQPRGRPAASRRAKALQSRFSRLADGALRHWLDTFHFFHLDSPGYTPLALRMEGEGSVTASATSTRNAKVQASAASRRVYEVANCRDARGERWMLICWEIDAPGIQFCECADRDEAMMLFTEPSMASGRWRGVRLRPEKRPW